ncbi:hypothetical protein [Exiguobacterium sp. KJ 601]|uniref:hypothetical protein n=1 Tax=Exiguobacterium sp. KJ 601 TaxID=2782569 RepID=UPI0022AF5EC1|nr:hypothetical protein [Exiguobacterium sp. KJ 601]
MIIEHRNTLTPTDLKRKDGFTRVKVAIQNDPSQVFVVRSPREEEEIVLMSVANAERLMALEERFNRFIDASVFHEFERRQELGLQSHALKDVPGVDLDEDDVYIPLALQKEEGDPR